MRRPSRWKEADGNGRRRSMTMLNAEARVATAMAGRYLSQLCKHFAHRLPVEQEEGHGRIELPSGVCVLDTDGPDLLVLRAEAPDEAALDQVQSVIARHLERFAFRDNPEIRWTRMAT